MNELQLTYENGVFYANSRQIAEMIGKEHKNLLRDIDGYINVLSQSSTLSPDDFFKKSSYKAGTGKTYPCYKITRKGCDMVANKLIGEKGILFTGEYVTRFEEMKEALSKNKAQLPDFTNPVEAARAWANEVEAKQNALKQIEADKPKVLFAEAVETAKSSILVGELAKLIKQNGIDIGQQRLFNFMRENGYLIKQKGSAYNMPTQKSMNLGLFEIKERTINHSDHVEIVKTPKVTGKGQIYFINMFAKSKMTA